MSALGGLVLIATGMAFGIPAGWIWCWYTERHDRIRVRDNIRRIRQQEERLVVEVAALEAENAELRDFLEWERQESA